jgi:hypothetical protein
MSPRISAPSAVPRRAPLADRPGRGAGRGAAGCPIVGVGASAGGLEAFTQLLKQLPVDTGFGFVLVQHLDPQHESALAQLLQRVTTMPVREAQTICGWLANHVYIIPPNTDLGITRGSIETSAALAGHRTAPRSIDFFFEALAKDQGERAIGVILSGSGDRRHAGAGGDQGGGRADLCAGRFGPLRLHAAQRGRRRLRGFGALAGRTLAGTGADRPASLRRRPAAGAGPAGGPHSRRRGPRRRDAGRCPSPAGRNRTTTRKSCCCCAIIAGWIFPSTNPAPSSGASRGAWC